MTASLPPQDVTRASAPNFRAPAPYRLVACWTRDYRSDVAASTLRVCTSSDREDLVNRLVMSWLAIVLVAAVGGSNAQAQVRRSAPDGAGGPARGEAPKGIPRSAQHPYAGVWDGTFTLRNGPGGEHDIPIVMVLIVADSAKGDYSGATILPNGARAPHLETTVVHGEMRWKQENSGGGFWVYAGKIVSRDSIAGTVALEDWPQLPPGEKPPSGTFALVRRPAGK
jgi:hypothetical protein